MRIVHVLTRLLRAGSEENTLITAAGQIARGHEVIILHGSDALQEFAHNLAAGARLVEVPELVHEPRPVQDMIAVRRISQILREIEPDVVHTHQSKAGIVGRLAAKLAGVPVIIHGVHILPFLGVGPLRKFVYLGIERLVARTTDGFIHVSEGMRSSAREHGVGPRKPHYVVPSGFNLGQFRNAKPAEDLQFLLKNERGERPLVVISMLAALEPRKRHLQFLQHGSQFLKSHPNVRVLFSGEGHLRSEIEDAISQNGLERQVLLLGYRTDPASVLAAADIGILCAEREGLPRCILQSLVSGLPVVVFDLPGIEEAIAEGTNGFIAPEDDWTSYFASLEELVEDEARRSKMADNARGTPLERWDADYMAESTLAIYEELLGSPEEIGVFQ